MGRELGESLLYILVFAGRCLHKFHAAVLLAVRLSLCLLDDSSILCKIKLVTDHHEGESLWGTDHTLLQEAVFPIGNILERPVVCHIIHEEGAVSSSVESCPKRLISFLSGGVPDLQCHYFVVDGNLFVREVRADRGLEVLCEASVLKHLDQTRLADARVSDCHDLNEALLLRADHWNSLHIAWRDRILLSRWVNEWI